MTIGRFQVLRRSPESASLPGERDLVLRAQQGDTGAFKQLYDHYKDRIHTVIYYSLRDDDATEDVLQTVFVKVFQALPLFRLESCFLTWVYRVALNECKNRRRRRKLFVPISDAEEVWNKYDPGALPDAQHASEQMQQEVRVAVLALRPKLRAVVVLRYIEDLSYEEIAAVLGSSPGTVASRLHRALAVLESRLSRSVSQNELR